MKKKAKKTDRTTALAAPVREFLRQMLRGHIKTLEDRRRLAEFLGHSPTSVGNLLKGEGSLDTWVAVICYYYQIDAEKLLEIVQSFESLLRKYQPLESDRIAAQIKLPEAQRKILFSALLTAIKVTEKE